MSTIDVAAIGPDEIADDLRDLASQLDLDLDGVEIAGDSSLETDLEMDSLNLMDFLVHLERRYHVRIADDLLGGVDTIDDVATLINRLRAEPAADGER